MYNTTQLFRNSHTHIIGSKVTLDCTGYWVLVTPISKCCVLHTFSYQIHLRTLGHGSDFAGVCTVKWQSACISVGLCKRIRALPSAVYCFGSHCLSVCVHVCVHVFVHVVYGGTRTHYNSPQFVSNSDQKCMRVVNQTFLKTALKKYA